MDKRERQGIDGLIRYFEACSRSYEKSGEKIKAEVWKNAAELLAFRLMQIERGYEFA